MTKLTDTQLIILSQASARDDGCAVLPEGRKAAGAIKAGASLLERKLMKEVRAKVGLPVWRTDEDNRAFSLVLTAAGRKAIQADEPGPMLAGKSASSTATASVAKQPGPAIEAKAAAAAAAPVPPAQERRPMREGSKQALVVKMLSGKAGTTLPALVDATGWLPHTIRAALTGLRKRGLAITRESREGKPSLYRIEEAAA